MAGQIVNGAPRNYNFGAADYSARIIPPIPDPVPQHCPNIYFFGQRGPTEPILMSGSKYIPYYGSRTFDPLDVFYNHQTELAMLMSNNANACVMKRLIPEDNLVKANVSVYVDIISDLVPNYVRNSYGVIQINPTTNTPMINPTTPTIAGHRIKFIAESSSVTTDKGLLTTKSGTMTDSDGNKSTMYPMYELLAGEFGADYNNYGITISTPAPGSYDKTMMTKTGYFNYLLSVFYRTDAKSTGSKLNNIMSSSEVPIVFKPRTVNQYGMRVDIETVLGTWSNTTNPLFDTVYPEFDKIYFYHNYFDDVLKIIYDTEAPHIDAGMTTWSDGIVISPLTWFDLPVGHDDTDKGLLNILTCKSSTGVNYFTAVIDAGEANLVSGQREIMFGSKTPVYLENGSDGTLSNEMFEKAVRAEMDKYLDINSDVMNTVLNPGTHIYDTGFTVGATKNSLAAFLAIRVNTFLNYSTHDASLDESEVDESTMLAIATGLGVTLGLYPESVLHGTSVTRACIIPGTGLKADMSSSNRMAGTFELANKASKLMGSSDGQWKTTYLFDSGTNSDFDYLIDYHPKVYTYDLETFAYEQGFIVVGPSRMNVTKFLAMNTVFSDQTSVLHGYFTVMAMIHCNTLSDQVHLMLTGNQTLSEASFIQAVEQAMNKKVANAFGNSGVVTIISTCVIDEYDKARGYSWHLINKIGGNIIKTAQTTESRMYRAEDLAAQNTAN